MPQRLRIQMNFEMANNTRGHFRLSRDLLIEIFVRSSVESLLREKCVCKQWYALIKKQEFRLDYLHYQKTKNKGRLLLQYFEEDTKQYGYALFDDETLVNETYHNIVRLSCSLIITEGPVNGLYCLFNGTDRIVLWNPALVEFFSISLPHAHFFPHIKLSKSEIGFGIDLLTHDFKLVMILNFWGCLDYRLSSTHVSVYNLTTNTWRLMYDLRDSDLISLRFYHRPSTSFLNGIYYWLTSRFVIGFHMGKETFREIMGPDLSNFESTSGQLTLYNDKVALAIDVFEESLVNVWVMLQEGVWIKQFSVISLIEDYWNVGLWKNDEYLFAISKYETELDPNSQTIMYSASNQERRNLGPRGIVNRFKASIYYESIQSVYFGTGIEGKYTSNEVAEFLNCRM